MLITSTTQMAGEKEVKAQVRLRFWNAKRERMTATRNLQVTTKKTGQLTMKTLEGILAKTDIGDGNGKVCKLLDAVGEITPADIGVTEKYHLYEMFRNGRRSTIFVGRVKGHP